MTLKNQKRVPKVAVIGGGFSGICSAIQIKKQFPIDGISLTIFDENEDFGGTWLANRYPGAACDVPALLYSFSFEQNPYWSKLYADRSEILQYILNIARKFKLYDHARFSTAVQSLEWLESKGEWKAVVQDSKNLNKASEIINYDYVICASGFVRNPNIPPEFSKFSGKLIHSARWDSTLDLKGKVVGVVGSGASAGQIVPSIASQAKEAHIYQRQPVWVWPRPQIKIPTVIQGLLKKIPVLNTILRWFVFLSLEFLHVAFGSGRILGLLIEQILKLQMWLQLKGDKKLLAKLTPKYKMGCNRFLVTNSYFPAFTQTHVNLHTEKIEKVQNNIITTSDGEEQNLDVLILATGFHFYKYFSPIQIKGRAGVDLFSKWNMDGPNCFLGVMTSDAPNLFFILGPTSITAHNSAIFVAECQVDFLLKLIKETERRGAKAVAVSKAVEQVYMDSVAKDMETKVWQTEPCGSWYKNERKQATAIWPNKSTSLWWTLKAAYKNKQNFRWISMVDEQK